MGTTQNCFDTGSGNFVCVCGQGFTGPTNGNGPANCQNLDECQWGVCDSKGSIFLTDRFEHKMF